MPTIGLYFTTALTQAEVNALRTRLNELAARHGYLALRGATKARGEGNLAAMLVGLDKGELAIIRLPDERINPSSIYYKNLTASEMDADIVSVIVGHDEQ